MKQSEIVAKANALGVNGRGLKRMELIKAIQKAEGNRPCLGNLGIEEHCSPDRCCWYKDCVQQAWLNY
jgi:hypothetical protein